MKRGKSKARIIIRSRVPFPPTKVFADKKKEQKRKACRGKSDDGVSSFCLSFKI